MLAFSFHTALRMSAQFGRKLCSRLIVVRHSVGIMLWKECRKDRDRRRSDYLVCLGRGWQWRARKFLRLDWRKCRQTLKKGILAIRIVCGFDMQIQFKLKFKLGKIKGLCRPKKYVLNEINYKFHVATDIREHTLSLFPR